MVYNYKAFFGNRASGVAPSPPPNGWHRPFETAAVRVIIPVALSATGLAWCPQPIAASPAPATVYAGWQQPLEVAPKTARAIQSDPAFVPLAPAQYSTGWQQPLATAVKLTGPVHTQPSFVVPPFAVPQGWQQPLSNSPPVSKVQSGDGFTPFNTAQTYNTIDKWQQPLAVAVRIAGPSYSQPTFVVPPFEVPRGWQQSLSGAPLTAKAPYADQPLPFYPVVVVVDNTVTIDKWQQPLSVAALVAQAKIGDGFVPFNTVQTTPGLVTIDKYQQPLSTAPAVARSIDTNVAFVALPFPQYPTAWQQPLSKAAPVAKPVFVDVPFVARDTQFTQNTVDIGRWLQPLGTAPPTASVAAEQPTLVSVPFDIPRGWYQPLSVAVTLAKAADSALVYVPYPPTAAVVAGIEGMAWHTPLGTPVLQLSYSLSPFASWTPAELVTVPPVPPIEVVPPVVNDPAGIQSAAWKPRKKVNYRSYRFLSDKEIEQLTGAEIREAARELRADVRKDPLAEEVEKEVAALARMAAVLSDIDRLEASVAELTRAIDFAAEQKLKAEAEQERQDAEDEEIAIHLLS